MKYALYPECYKDFITLKNCTSSPSKSGLYVEQLEGLSSKATAQVAGPAQGTASDLVHESLMTVLGMYETKLQAYLQQFGYFVPPLPLKFREYGNFSCGLNSPTIPVAPIERGLKISRYANLQPFAGLYIHDLTIKTTHTGPATILFRDSQGNLVYSLSANLDASRAIQVPVQKLFSQDVLFVLLDNTSISPYSGQICTTFDCCNEGCKTYNRYAPRGYWVQGWDGTKAQNECYGIGINLGLGCDPSRLLSYVLPHLKYAILYSLGVQILEHLQASERINYFALSNKEWAAEKALQWGEKADLLWQQGLKVVLPSLAKLDTTCLQCDQANKPKIFSTV